MNSGLFAGGGNSESDLDFVGNGGDVGPHALADAEIQAFEGERAVKGGGVVAGTECHRNDHVAASSLEREGAAHFVAVAAQRANLAGNELRLRVHAAVEPQRAG